MVSRYEYKVIDTARDIERQLNDLGAEGWQVVGVTTKKQLLIAPPAAIILMREVQPAAANAAYTAGWGPRRTQIPARAHPPPREPSGYLAPARAPLIHPGRPDETVARLVCVRVVDVAELRHPSSRPLMSSARSSTLKCSMERAATNILLTGVAKRVLTR